MKRHLHIAIDANRVTCGKCDFVRWRSPVMYDCAAFRQRLMKEAPGDDWLRCAQCLAAEREATG